MQRMWNLSVCSCVALQVFAMNVEPECLRLLLCKFYNSDASYSTWSLNVCSCVAFHVDAFRVCCSKQGSSIDCTCMGKMSENCYRIPKTHLDPLIEKNRALGMTLTVAKEKAREQYIKEVIVPRFKKASSDAASAIKEAKGDKKDNNKDTKDMKEEATRKASCDAEDAKEETKSTEEAKEEAKEKTESTEEAKEEAAQKASCDAASALKEAKTDKKDTKDKKEKKGKKKDKKDTKEKKTTTSKKVNTGRKGNKDLVGQTVSPRVIAKRKKPEDEQTGSQKPAVVVPEPGQAVIKPVKPLWQTQLTFMRLNGLRQRTSREQPAFQGWPSPLACTSCDEIVETENAVWYQPEDEEAPLACASRQEILETENVGAADFSSSNFDRDLANVVGMFAGVDVSSDLDWLFVQGNASVLDLIEDAEDTAPEVVISRCR